MSSTRALNPLPLKRPAAVQVGGRLVYSTCTFNPLEDEAVVAAVLELANGAMRLVDMSGALPELKRCPGISTWQVRPAPPRPPQSSQPGQLRCRRRFQGAALTVPRHSRLA